METLGVRLKNLRLSLNLTAKAVKESINIDDLGRYEKDERKPNIDSLLALANFYNVSTDWLLTGEGNIKKNNQNHQDYSTETTQKENNIEYETIIISEEQNDLLEYYKKLDREEQIEELTRIKTIVEFKEKYKQRKDASTTSKVEKKRTPVNKAKAEKAKAI